MVRYKGKDLIELGHHPYDEANYGSSPGIVTLFRIGYIEEIAPLYDPQLSRLWTVNDQAIHQPLALMRRLEDVRLRMKWLQGTLGDPIQEHWLLNHSNLYMEAKMDQGGTDVYLKWTGVKPDVLRAQCSLGEPVRWTAECIGKSFDTASTTQSSYGARAGALWEWEDTYLQISAADAGYALIPDVTDWEFIIRNNLKQNFVFNDAGSKQLTTLEEMEQDVTVNFTMNIQDETYIEYLLDQDELYIKLVLPDTKYLKAMKGKFSHVDPLIKPEDMIAARCVFEAKYLVNGFL